MLAIRMQRTGRKKQAQFRVIVQDSHATPTSGKVVAYLGAYDPHTKKSTLDTEKAKFYLDHGAQPSDRVVKLLVQEKVELPSWVKVTDNQSRTTRNPEKLRKNQPKEETPAEEPAVEAPASEDEVVAEAPVAEEVAEETPAETVEEATETPTDTKSE